MVSKLSVCQVLPDGEVETHNLVKFLSYDFCLIPDWIDICRQWLSHECNVSSHFEFKLIVDLDFDK